MPPCAPRPELRFIQAQEDHFVTDHDYLHTRQESG